MRSRYRKDMCNTSFERLDPVLYDRGTNETISLRTKNVSLLEKCNLGQKWPPKASFYGATQGPLI